MHFFCQMCCHLAMSVKLVNSQQYGISTQNLAVKLAQHNFSRASDNMLTGGAISPPLEQIAPPVTDVCPSSENLKS